MKLTVILLDGPAVLGTSSSNTSSRLTSSTYTHDKNMQTHSWKIPALKTLFSNMQCPNRLPHGTVRQHEVIRRWAVQILGLFLPLPLTILLIDVLNCPGNQVLGKMPSLYIFLINTSLSLLYFTCMDIQVLRYPLRCPGYLCGLVPGNPSRAGRCSAGESRPT